MIANIVSVSRVVLTFGVLFVFGKHPRVDIAVIPTIAFIIVLDAVDGSIARQRNEVSPLGEVLDTLADRVIENSFWIYFTVQGLIPVWMPVLVMARGFLSDALQGLHGYPTTGWRYALTRSRLSRAVSGITKLLAFSSLAGAKVFRDAELETCSFLLASLAVCVCLLRGVPFVLREKHP